MQKFSDVFEFKKKSKIKAGDGMLAGKFPFYTSSNLQTKYLDNFLFEGDSLIFGTGGEASIHFNSDRFAVSTDCLVAQLKDKDKMLTKYIFYYLKGNIYILENGFKGAGLKHISKGYINQINLPKAELKEQKKAVAILDRTDSLLKKRKQSVQILDEFLRSTFLSMFGNPFSNPKKMPMKKIGVLGKVITGNTPPREKKEYYGNYIEWIKSDNINTPQFNLTKAKEYLSKSGASMGRIASKGSILVTCIAGSPECIGNVAMADRDVAFNQQINAFIPGPEISQKFFFAQVLFCKKLIQNVSTSGMKGLVSKGRFSDIKIMVPPKEEQKKFEKIFDLAANLRIKMKDGEDQIEKQFDALTQKAFGDPKNV